ncbi:DUF2690 domain-containing protein [Demequina sp. NBRC 110057]|uniref:DUF2690 domain-containing protein n=1 Tax=Demequina sp. NBRC 110057 TaxID=1570346 RepID=UPI0013564EFF|nr:DUF2690 domain-containing protein [Demequina sp. NBRC 110057]
MTDASNGEGVDEVAAFAADLRRLRVLAGSPTFDRLHRETQISKSVLSDAMKGRSLPSARTVEGIVRACGEDPREWIDRRDRIASPAPAASPGEADPTATARSARTRLALVGAAMFVAGAAVAGVTATLVAHHVIDERLAAAGVSEGPQIAVANGQDPAMTTCVEDAQVATGDTRADNSLLEIVWSNKCYAGWGRITRYDGLGNGNTVTIALYPQTAPDGADRQEATEHDVQSAYTTLLVRPSADTLLCAEGSFTVDGKRIDLGDPLCI